MGRTPSYDKNGLKRGTWTPEEDRKLIAYVTRYGCWNWRQLPKFAGLARCGKSCRLRWMNYLRPNIKRGDYTQEEEEIIITLHEKLGNKWSVIATHLPGRTDNEIKNHWHTTLKKRFQKNALTTHEKVNATTDSNDSGSKTDKGLVQNNGPMSPQLSSNEFSSTTSSDTNHTIVKGDFDFLDTNIETMNESFWTQSYKGDITYTPIETVLDNNGKGNFQGSGATEINESLFQENYHFEFLEGTQPTIEDFWTEPYVADISHVPNELLTPFLVESDEYFSTLCNVDLWNQSHLHNERVSFF